MIIKMLMNENYILVDYILSESFIDEINTRVTNLFYL